VAVYIRRSTELFRCLLRVFFEAHDGRARQKPSPYLSAARQEPNPTSRRSFYLKVGNLEHHAQVWSRARPLRPTRTASLPFETHANGFFLSSLNVRNPLLVRQAQGRFLRNLPRAFESGREVCSPASRKGAPPRASEWSRGGRGVVFSSVRVGMCEGAKRGEVCSPATCEVLFGARRWARARAGGRGRGGARSSARRDVLRVGVGEGAAAYRSTNRRRSDLFLGACRRGRRLGCL